MTLHYIYRGTNNEMLGTKSETLDKPIQAENDVMERGLRALFSFASRFSSNGPAMKIMARRVTAVEIRDLKHINDKGRILPVSDILNFARSDAPLFTLEDEEAEAQKARILEVFAPGR